MTKFQAYVTVAAMTAVMLITTLAGFAIVLAWFDDTALWFLPPIVFIAIMATAKYRMRNYDDPFVYARPPSTPEPPPALWVQRLEEKRHGKKA